MSVDVDVLMLLIIDAFLNFEVIFVNILIPMRQIIVFFCLSAMSHIAVGQNIVPNASFAVDSLCPLGLSELNYCEMWRSATQASPDYFNACDPVVYSAGAPANIFGYQSSADQAYAGIFAYIGASWTYPDYREYITTTIPALQTGAAYKVTVVVSLADSSLFAIDGLGVCFSVDPISSDSLSIIDRTPQVDYKSYGVMNDKTNWTSLTKNFIADSAYTHLTIGSFTLSSAMTRSICAYGNTFDSAAYYYIDSVAVEKISPSFVRNVGNSNIVAIYPNPFTGHATLTFNNIPGELYRLDIYNFQGVAVAEIKDINTGEVRIDRADLPSGLYYYMLRGQSGFVANGKLMME